MTRNKLTPLLLSHSLKAPRWAAGCTFILNRKIREWYPSFHLTLSKKANRHISQDAQSSHQALLKGMKQTWKSVWETLEITQLINENWRQNIKMLHKKRKYLPEMCWSQKDNICKYKAGCFLSEKQQEMPPKGPEEQKMKDPSTSSQTTHFLFMDHWLL